MEQKPMVEKLAARRLVGMQARQVEGIGRRANRRLELFLLDENYLEIVLRGGGSAGRQQGQGEENEGRNGDAGAARIGQGGGTKVETEEITGQGGAARIASGDGTGFVRGDLFHRARGFPWSFRGGRRAGRW